MKINFSLPKGFIQIPVLLVLLGLTALGGLTALKAPQIIQDRAYQKISQETGVPVGSASSGEILIGFKTDVSPARRDQAHQQSRATLKSRISRINTDAIKVPAGSTAQETINRYQNLPEVEYAESNFLATAFLTPNDAFYPRQWNLKKIISEEAYDLSQGGFGPIAIIDTGVDGSHPDLSGLVIEGYNTITDTTNTADDFGHGTHVAGIASARTNNTNGVASISYQSPILPIKVLGADGIGTYDDVAEGIIYAADQNARILNLSLGGGSDSKTLKRAVAYALNRGSIIVASAGNNGNTAAVYPAAYPGVLAVSATDQNDNLAGFSSYGASVFVASPGVSITSSLPGGRYGEASGTSMSAPHLSGLIAISLSKNPRLTNSQVIDQIKANAEKVGSYPYDENGWNPYFGYGRINSGRTIRAIAQAESTPVPQSSPSPAPTSSPTPTPVADSVSSDRLPAKTTAPKEYSFSFSLQGTIESLDLGQSLITAKVDGGTPNITYLLSGNLVNVYVDSTTRLKYQNQSTSLNQLLKDSRLHVKGNIVQNKLLALEILIQTLPTAPVPPSASPNEGSPDSDQNPGQPTDSESRQQPHPPAVNPAPAQNPLPEQSQGRGRVKGAASSPSVWQQLKFKILALFQ